MSTEERIIIKSYRELPPMAASMGRMSVNNTGSWRNVEPYYVNQTPPCSLHCPAGNDAAGFLKLTAEGKFREAWELIRETSPFPGVCGRVCPHPCESECNRETLGGRINVHSIERFLADMNFDASVPGKNIKYPDISIGIIGSGPAGLSAAYHLAMRGYPVIIYESHETTGGMMRIGIPDYRLPKVVLDREINFIQAMGVDIRTGFKIGVDAIFSEIRRRHSALFIATGFHQSRKMGIESEEHPDVIPGIEILKRISQGLNPNLKEKVLVIGGGNTAMDTARSAMRFGSKVTVVYRRTREEMPAIADEIEELLSEGIPIEFLTAPVKIHTKDGNIVSLECIRMKLGEADDSGRRRPIPIVGSNFRIETDQVISAVGETPDLSFIDGELKFERWGIPTDDFGLTNMEGVFAGGDVSAGDGTVTHAIGSGRRAAIAIVRYLKGEKFQDIDKISPSLQNAGGRIVRLDDLNLDYFADLPRLTPPSLEIDRRRDNFREVTGSYDAAMALAEAQRCMSCGVCTSCDNCFIFCPDAAIDYNLSENSKYTIDLDYCKGCGICAQECPRRCIELK
ncbi:FAD-dependent oxidoreductase [bacterium]|nr:FAD-dependent oxidoreductase [bacterium]